jgi:hypothetical protein
MMAANARRTTIHEVTRPRAVEVIRAGLIAFPLRKMNRDFGSARASRGPRRGLTVGQTAPTSRVARVVASRVVSVLTSRQWREQRQRQILDHSGSQP